MLEIVLPADKNVNEPTEHAGWPADTLVAMVVMGALGCSVCSDCGGGLQPGARWAAVGGVSGHSQYFITAKAEHRDACVRNDHFTESFSSST